MTKIIPFRPIQQEQHVQSKPISRQIHCEYCDEILDEVILSEKPKVSKPLDVKIQQEIKNQAKQFYNSALLAKNYLYRLIDKGFVAGFEDFYDGDNNLVTFEEDNLGRYVLVECDRDGNDKRRTVFSPNDGEIFSIETDNQKIVFFNYKDKYTEIRTETKPNWLGKSFKEIYCFSNHNLCAYSKYKQSLFYEDVLLERHEFVD